MRTNLLIAVLLLLPTSGRGADAPSPEHLRFFESEVRPLLVRRCLECHSAEKTKGGLRLDSRAGMLQGGESGDAAVVPGKANTFGLAWVDLSTGSFAASDVPAQRLPDELARLNPAEAIFAEV